MKKMLWFSFGIFFLLGISTASFSWQYFDFINTPVNITPENAQFEILPGSTINQVATQLQQQGIITHPTWFVWYAKYRDQAESLKAGEYQITPGSKPADLLDQFVSGRVMQHTLRIGEGWTFADVMQAVSTHPTLVQTLPSKHPRVVAQMLGIRNGHPEGWFFPETYSFPKGTTDIAFLQRAYRIMQITLDREWMQRSNNLPYKTPYEALIMASIIEKETGLSVEHAQVGGVFTRRLKIGMRLQADPTVVYGLGDQYQDQLTRTNLDTPTPYNTYTIKGLPPTPIAMPSLAAISAALHPAPGDALYFVATGDGGHQFSATLAEHNVAVAKYREWEAQQKLLEQQEAQYGR